MRISKTLRYEAEPDVVYEMLTDPDFHAMACEATHAVRHDQQVTSDAGHTTVVVNRSLSTEKMPHMIQSVLGAHLTIHETYVWGDEPIAGRRHGELQVTLGGAPLHMKAKVVLMASGDDSLMTIDGELKADIFMGGRIEKMAAPWIVKAFDKEEETGAVWLAEE